MHIKPAQKLAIVSTLASVRGDIIIIKGIEEGARAVWENSRDQKTGTHLIEGVAFSNLKTESLKTFSAAVLKLAFNAQGKTINGFTDDMIEEDSTRFTHTVSRMAAISALTFDHAFSVIMSAVVGYDEWFVAQVLNIKETSEEMGRLAFTYTAKKLCNTDAEYVEDMILSTLDPEYLEHMNTQRDEWLAAVLEKVMSFQVLDPFRVLIQATEISYAKTGVAVH